MVEGESLMAFLDDIYLVTSPTRVGAVYRTLSAELHRCHIRVHTRKTRVWNAEGVRLDACDWLEREAVWEDAGPVWRGSEVSPFQQGVKILGTPHHGEINSTDQNALSHRACSQCGASGSGPEVGSRAD